MAHHGHHHGIYAPAGVERVGDEGLHGAEILHAVHVPVGVGLLVVPDADPGLDESPAGA